MIKIKLFIGLGNPGEEYKNTRHSAGFIFVDELAESLKSAPFTFDKKLNAEISVAGKNLILAKPQTFMNKSGLAAGAMAKYFKIKPENVLVAHDDIDIAWGDFKLSFGRSSAGHKGVESIIKNLKTKDFWRLRIGIKPISAASSKQKVVSKKQKTIKIKAEKIILKKFTPTELKTLSATIKKAIPAVAGTAL